MMFMKMNNSKKKTYKNSQRETMNLLKAFSFIHNLFIY